MDHGCACGRTTLTRLACLQCAAEGNWTLLCGNCGTDGYCKSCYHDRFRSRGCGCRTCRKIAESVNRIERLQEALKNEDDVPSSLLQRIRALIR